MPVLIGSLMSPTISTAVPNSAPSGTSWSLWSLKRIALVPLGSRYPESGSPAASGSIVAHRTIADNMATNAPAVNMLLLLGGIPAQHSLLSSGGTPAGKEQPCPSPSRCGDCSLYEIMAPFQAKSSSGICSLRPRGWCSPSPSYRGQLAALETGGQPDAVPEASTTASSTTTGTSPGCPPPAPPPAPADLIG